MGIDTSMYNSNPGQSFASSFTDAYKTAAQVRESNTLADLHKTQADAAKQEFQDQNDIRAAKQSAGGDPTQTLAQLGKVNQSAATKYKGELAQQQMLSQQMQESQLKLKGEQLGMIGRVGLAMKDQNSYVQGIQYLKSVGVDTSDAPPAYDKAWVDFHTGAALTAKDKLDLNLKQQEADAKTLESKAKAYESGMPMGAGGSAGGNGGAGAGGGSGFNPPPKMQVEQMKNYNDAVSGSRQQQDAQQEMKNTLAAANLNEIVEQAPIDPKTGKRNLDGLNPQQTKLAFMELVKMAGGSIPTEHELAEMTPNTLVQKYAETMQKLTGKSKPNNAGEFLQQGLDYANGIANISKQRLAARENDIADRFRQGLGDKNYKLVKGQIAKQYGDGEAKKDTDKGPPAHSFSLDALMAEKARRAKIAQGGK